VLRTTLELMSARAGIMCPSYLNKERFEARKRHHWIV